MQEPYPQLYESLKIIYPDFFRYCDRIDCGPGWFKLIEKLVEDILDVIQKEKLKGVALLDIRERFGSLKFEMEHDSEEIDKLIYQAKKDSESICLRCGEEGRRDREAKFSVPYYGISCLCVKCRGH